MPEIKVGQIRKDSLGLYVITYDLTNCAIVYQDGEVREWGGGKDNLNVMSL